MIKDSALSEITLRRYEKPYQELTKRELIKKICLSFGLLQEGDSRDVVVDVLFILFEAKKIKREMDEEEIKNKVIDLRKSMKLELKGIANSNIRRQLKRLRDILLVEKISSKYRMSDFSDISEIFEKKIEKFLIPQIIERIKEYVSELEK
jgi:hypothetical protein